MGSQVSIMETCSVCHGRPQNINDRLQKEIEVYDRLDSLGIAYDVIDHDHADTLEQCRVISEKLGAPICKNLFLCNTQKTAFYLLLMPGDKPFKTKQLSPQLGCARLSFAPPEHMERLIGCTPGSASVFGLWFDAERSVKLVIDRDLLKNERIGCHPCINTSSVSVLTDDLLGRIIPDTGHEPVFVELTAE